VQVETTRLTRIRGLEITPERFRRLALAELLGLFVIVATGAIVRLTASGLGCDNWPRCGDTPFPEKSGHAVIEFSNRVVALVTIGLTLLGWLAARRVAGLPRWAATLALAVFLGTVAQIPLGGLTVIFELNPLLVMTHFLLALAVLGGGTVLALEAWGGERGRSEPLVPVELRRLALVFVAATLALIVTGTFVTAAGPHSGGVDIRRLGTASAAIWVHVRATALFGLCFLFILGYLAARRNRAPLLFRAALALLALVLVQIAVGETQYRTDLPWWLVLVHVSLAAAVWVGTVAFAAACWRPPLPLARAS